jgi:hypothetical protein
MSPQAFCGKNITKIFTPLKRNKLHFCLAACHLQGTLPFGMYLEDKSNDVFVMERHISIYVFSHMSR